MKKYFSTQRRDPKPKNDPEFVWAWVRLLKDYIEHSVDVPEKIKDKWRKVWKDREKRPASKNLRKILGSSFPHAENFKVKPNH